MAVTRLHEQPFAYVIRKDGSVAISHEGNGVAVISGDAAAHVTRKLQGGSAQEVQMALAKVTGNFKRGNERMAASHGRNRR